VIKKNKIRLLSKSLENAINVTDVLVRKEQVINIFKLQEYTLINVFKLTTYLNYFPSKNFYNKNYLFKINSYFFLKTYLKFFLNKFINVSFKANHSKFHYFIIKETTQQSFTSVLDAKKLSKVTYSTGLLLCAMGLKRNNMYKALKKQNKGFIKGLSFAKSFILPKFLKSNQESIKKVGIIIKGRGKFTTSYSELPTYFKTLQTETLFLL
jgi:hypothetical protein